MRQPGSHKILRHNDVRQTYVSIHTKDIPLGNLQKNPKTSEFNGRRN